MFFHEKKREGVAGFRQKNFSFVVFYAIFLKSDASVIIHVFSQA